MTRGKSEFEPAIKTESNTNNVDQKFVPFNIIVPVHSGVKLERGGQQGRPGSRRQTVLVSETDIALIKLIAVEHAKLVVPKLLGNISLTQV